MEIVLHFSMSIGTCLEMHSIAMKEAYSNIKVFDVFFLFDRDRCDNAISCLAFGNLMIDFLLCCMPSDIPMASFG